MKMYEINEEIRNMIDMLESGVIAFEDENGEKQYITEALNKLKLDRRKKLENIALAVEEIETAAEGLKERAKLLTERSKTVQTRADRLKEYIIHSMEAFGDKRIDGEICRLTIRKSDKVIVDEEFLPSEYWRTKPAEEEVDKIKIAKDLKLGKVIEGARFEKSTSLQIR